MPTKPKKRPKARKETVLPPMPPRDKFPPGFKGMKLEDILGKGRDLWDSDEELDEFLRLIRERRKY